METKKQNETQRVVELLSLLATEQLNTAKIDLSIGATSEDNHVEKNVVVIKQCPPAILEKVMQWAKVKDMGYAVSIEDQGLYIDCNLGGN